MLFRRDSNLKQRSFERSAIAHALGVLILARAAAEADPGATVPWTTYEAETMTISGGTIIGPQYSPNTLAAEASGRQCVQLNATGQSVQFTAQSAANAIVVRYSVPDSADGTGTNYTLSLYTNGVLAARLPVTSKFSWLYGSYPFTNVPTAGSPRNFFDEVRTNGLSIQAGDSVRLQKDSADTAASYVIDFAELENISAALSQPGGSVSVKSGPYNAAGDGVTDDTLALQNCINANSKVWLPPGNYKITGAISLPSNRTLAGAGMWYATLAGDATLYTNAARRVNLNGNGTNIQLADFAILGKLNYRNDAEGNDGIGGTYGAGSSIARIWIEHTKAAAWISNSRGLIVEGCRFRNTIADGINLNRGMQGTIVTNCTARGTGDDCFAMWPSAAGTYAAGSNVFTHCTGQLPFLASGGAIYGGADNRIEDCRFQDIPYGCGILLSTTFYVSNNIFSGTTFAQRSDVIRAGGYTSGYQWRAAVQLCLDSHTNGISGVNLNHLNLTDCVADGLGVIGGSGRLTNAVATDLNIVNCGLGTNGCTSLRARSDAVGSLTVSNSLFANYQNDSTNFSFNFLANTGAAVALVFTRQPGAAAANAAFNPPPVLKSVDAAGNPSALGLPASLQVFASLTNSPARLLGTTNFDIGTGAGNGIATFTDLAIDAAGTNVQLVARTGAASFGSPVSGMTIWLDANTTASVLTNAGGSVTNWLDQSGHGHHFNTPLGSGGNGIRYTNTAAFGRKVITFNATGSLAGTELKNTTYTNTAKTGSFFVVAKKNVSGTLEGQYQAVFATWAGNVANADYQDSGSFTLNYDSANTTPRAYRNGVCNNVCPALDPATNYVAFEYIANGTSAAGNDSFWSGLAGGTAAGNQNGSVSANPNFNIVAASVGGGLGAGGTSVNNPFAGSIAEVLVYDAALSDFDRTTVESYLRSKWMAPYSLTPTASNPFNVGAPAPPAQRITGTSLSVANGFSLTFGTTPGYYYHVEVTTNLLPPNWMAVAGSSNNATGTTLTFTDTNRYDSRQRFYQTVSP